MPAPITTMSTEDGSFSSLATGWTGGDTLACLDGSCEVAEPFLVGLVLDRDRELAMAHYLAIAVAEPARDLVVGADGHVSVQDVVVDMLRHLFPALRARQQLQLVGELAQPVMLEG